jgi:hypothetical protein
VTEPASDPANVIRNCRDDEPGDDEGEESWDNAAARSTCSSLEIGDSKGDSCRNCDLQENLPIDTHHHSPLIPTDRNMSHEFVCRKKNRHGPKVCPMQPEDDECLNRAFPNFRAATQPSATLLDMGSLFTRSGKEGCPVGEPSTLALSRLRREGNPALCRRPCHSSGGRMAVNADVGIQC